MSGDFSPEQKRYLEGFVSGLNAARATRGALPGGKGEPVGPDAIHLKAQDGSRPRAASSPSRRSSSASSIRSMPTTG